MSASLGALVPALRPYARALVDLAGRAGLQPRVTSTRRSHAEQARLYRRYLAGQQQYPVAPPGSSAHEFGMAFDMITSAMNLADLADLGKVWVSWGGVWGGDFDDPIHFELPGFAHAVRAKSNRILAVAKTAASLALPVAVTTGAPITADQLQQNNPWLFNKISGSVSYLERLLGLN